MFTIQTHFDRLHMKRKVLHVKAMKQRQLLLLEAMI